MRTATPGSEGGDRAGRQAVGGVPISGRVWVIPIHRTGRCRPDTAHPYLGQAHYGAGFCFIWFFLFLCGFSTRFSFFERFSSFILSKYIYIFGKCSNSKIVQIQNLFKF
jgi:hypothetical protein